MKLLFKQRFFSWLDSYDVYDENGNVVYRVKGQLSWGHCMKVFDAYDRELGMIKERILTFLPKFEIYSGGHYMGCIRKELTLFQPRFQIDFCGWNVEGDIFEWNYMIHSHHGMVAAVTRQWLNWTDTYVLDVYNPADALGVLMLAIAIDAEKCSREA